MKRSAKFVLNVLLASVVVIGAAWAQGQTPDPRMVAANQLMQEKKFAEAALAFEAITKEQPGNGRALYQLAMRDAMLPRFTKETMPPLPPPPGQPTPAPATPRAATSPTKP